MELLTTRSFLASVAAHGALVVVAVLVPRTEPEAAPPETVLVSFEVDAVAPPSPAEEPPAPPPARARAETRAEVIRPHAPPLRMRAPAPAPDQEPPPAEPETATLPVEETPTPAGDDAPTAAPDGPAAAGPSSGVGSPSGTAVSGSGASFASRPAPPPPRLSEADRRRLGDRYLKEIFRTRINERFRYPPEARELELVGQVVVQVTIDRGGRLVGVRLSGGCPHGVLCEDGLRTIRASAPFPPLPADLGERLQIDVPLNYVFE